MQPPDPHLFSHAGLQNADTGVDFEEKNSRIALYSEFINYLVVVIAPLVANESSVMSRVLQAPSLDMTLHMCIHTSGYDAVHSVR